MGTMSYAMGQVTAAPVRPISPPQGLPVLFEDRQGPAGLTYRAVAPGKEYVLAGAMVGWKVREGADPDAVDVSVRETARLTPYTEATGPRDPGDGYRWILQREALGRGVIMIPPAGYRPGDDIMRATNGEIQLVATEDAADLALARPDAGGFVVYEPAGGWKGAAPGPGPEPGPGPADKSDWKKPAAYAAVAVVAVGGAYLLLRR